MMIPIIYEWRVFFRTEPYFGYEGLLKRNRFSSRKNNDQRSSIFFRTPFHEYFEFFRSVGCNGKAIAKACRKSFRGMPQTIVEHSGVSRVPPIRNMDLS